MQDRFDKINIIANAALDVLTDAGAQTDKMSVFMDIDNVDLVCPLRLDEMAEEAEARTFDFRHDVIGIWNHFDRDTKTLRDCFVPRFAK